MIEHAVDGLANHPQIIGLVFRNPLVQRTGLDQA